MYVIGRLAPEHPSGCIYWNGRVRPHEAAGGGDYAETAAPESVWTANSRDIAEATALWLNTSPVAIGLQGEGLWQAMPLPAEFGGDIAKRMIARVTRGSSVVVVRNDAIDIGLHPASAEYHAQDGDRGLDRHGLSVHGDALNHHTLRLRDFGIEHLSEPIAHASLPDEFLQERLRQVKQHGRDRGVLNLHVLMHRVHALLSRLWRRA